MGISNEESERVEANCDKQHEAIKADTVINKADALVLRVQSMHDKVNKCIEQEQNDKNRERKLSTYSFPYEGLYPFDGVEEVAIKSSQPADLPAHGILKKKSVDEIEPQSILRRKSRDENEVVTFEEARSPEKSILKKSSREESPVTSRIGRLRFPAEENSRRKSFGDEVRVQSPEKSILRKPGDKELSPTLRDATRRRSAGDEARARSPGSSEPRSIMKKHSFSADPVEVKPILKKRCSSEELENSEPKPILKKKHSTDEESDDRPKPILKLRARSSEELSDLDTKSILRVRTLSPDDEDNASEAKPIIRFKTSPEESPDEKPRSILKQRGKSFDEAEIRLAEPFDIPKPILKVRGKSHDDAMLSGLDKDSPRPILKRSEAEGEEMPKLPPKHRTFGETFRAESLDGGLAIKKNTSSKPRRMDCMDGELASILRFRRTKEGDESDDDNRLESFHQNRVHEIQESKVSVMDRIKNLQSQVQETVPEQPRRSLILGEPILRLERSSSSVSSSSQKPSRRSDRYKTQPVTNDEINSMEPRASVVDEIFGEGDGFCGQQQTVEASNLRVIHCHINDDPDKLSVMQAYFSKDTHKPTQAVTRVANPHTVPQFETSSPDEEMPKLNVLERARAFQQIQQNLVLPKEKRSRLQKLKRSERSHTQPVTPAEVQQAAQKDDIPDDDPSKLSLQERVRLFNQPVQKEETPKKLSPPRKIRRNSSRFKSQPISTADLQRVSPLAASLGPSPDDLEKIGNMSAAAAKQAMYEHGQELLQAIRKDSPPLRTPPDGAPSSPQKGILKKEYSETYESREVKGILKPQVESDNATKLEPKSILKLDRVKTIGEDSQSSSSENLCAHSSRNEADPNHRYRHESSSSSEDLNVPPEKNLAKQLANISEQAREESALNLQKGKGGLRRRSENLRRQEEQRKDAYDMSWKLFEKEIKPRRAEEQEQEQETMTSTVQSSSSVRQETIMGCGAIKSLHAVLTSNEVHETKRRSMSDSVPGGGIKDRKALLERTSETQWKERLAKTKTDDPHFEIKGPLKTKRRTRDERPSSLTDRITSLQISGEGWRQRVGDKDAKNFTVEGKLERLGKTVPLSTSSSSSHIPCEKKTPTPCRFRSKTENLPLELVSPATKPRLSLPATDAADKPEDSPWESVSSVAVHQADDETFASFFPSVTQEKMQDLVSPEILDADLDELFESSSRTMLTTKRVVRVTRRTVGSRNPLKALAARTDLQSEYREIRTDIAQQELKRINKEKIAAGSSLAVEALAGLASKENFNAITLKKTEESKSTDIMLVQVKGRHHPQARLIEPAASSINSGDAYILVTPDEVITFLGAFCNVIERSRAAELSNMIVAKKELRCNAKSVSTIDEEKQTVGTHVSRFWRHLNAPENRKASGFDSPEEDGLYEQQVVHTNKVYELVEAELVPIEKYWGGTPKYSILEEQKLLVFDFGTEMYVWTGKKAPTDARKIGRKLAKEMWDQGYDYTECLFNPVNGAPHRQPAPYPSKSSERPPWAKFFTVNQHMEHVLFREKFHDWPDMSRLIKVKDNGDQEKTADDFLELQPCDVDEMLQPDDSWPNLVLENSCVGRGVKYFDEEEKRVYEVITVGVSVWHVLVECDPEELPVQSHGQLFNGDTYVFRWNYLIRQKGRALTGGESRHTQTGRKRYAYFFWQGRNSSVNEKGASALMTVELNKELGQHVRVPQGKESPAFLNLFGGGLVIHDGKRDEVSSKKEWKLYSCRGVRNNEGFLVEVPVRSRSLRSRGCFVLVNTLSGRIIVWYGSKSSHHLQQVALHCAEQIQKNQPEEFEFDTGVDLTIREDKENKESRMFLRAFGNLDRNSYVTGDLGESPRVWKFSSWTGSFQATPVLCSFRDPEIPVAFPLHQTDLYRVVDQPALLLLDCVKEMWIWQGWWPEAENENSTMCTGSFRNRWTQQRRAAIQTALTYAQNKYPHKPTDVWLVWAGLEPLSFINLFPEWEDFPQIAELNLKEEFASEDARVAAETVLEKLSRSFYSIDELRERPLPEGVNPNFPEHYLNDKDFQTVMNMDREEFQKLPSWKQKQMRRDARLF